MHVPLKVIGTAAAKAAVASLISKLHKTVGSHLTSREDKSAWANAVDDPEELFLRAMSVRRVKTILDLENPRDLESFYYPARVRAGGRVTVPEYVDDFPSGGVLVVRAAVGQGKSILLRFLASNEFVRGDRMPLFYELRQLSDGDALEDALIAELGVLGLPANAAGLQSLMREGNLVLLLDGFDELKVGEQPKVAAVLRRLSMTHPALRVVVSSRPDTAIVYSATSRVVDLLPLAAGEWRKLLEKLEEDVPRRTRIHTQLTPEHPVNELLTNPLIVALLIVRFRLEQTIPENLDSFYAGLFELLATRHDRTKDGFERARKSALGDTALLRAFNAFCHVVLQQGPVFFSRAQAIQMATKGLSATDASADASDFLQDIVSITSLLLREGDEYAFIHKSVAEYHAAYCLARDFRTHDLATRFYNHVRTRPNDTALWGVLDFLRRLDSDGFLVHQWRPLLYDLRLGPPPGQTATDISKQLRAADGGVTAMFNAAHRLHQRFALLRASAPPQEEHLFTLSEKVLNQQLAKGEPGTPFVPPVPGAGRGSHEGTISRWWTELHAALARANREVERLQRRVELLEPK